MRDLIDYLGTLTVTQGRRAGRSLRGPAVAAPVYPGRVPAGDAIRGAVDCAGQREDHVARRDRGGDARRAADGTEGRNRDRGGELQSGADRVRPCEGLHGRQARRPEDVARVGHRTTGNH